jgi:hypothetical protein
MDLGASWRGKYENYIIGGMWQKWSLAGKKEESMVFHFHYFLEAGFYLLCQQNPTSTPP